MSGLQLWLTSAAGLLGPGHSACNLGAVQSPEYHLEAWASDTNERVMMPDVDVQNILPRNGRLSQHGKDVFRTYPVAASHVQEDLGGQARGVRL